MARIKGEMRIFLHSVFFKKHKITIIKIWHIEANASRGFVIDSVRKMSFGEGIANHIKVGSILMINSTILQTSKPSRYFFTIFHFSPLSFRVSLIFKTRQ